MKTVPLADVLWTAANEWLHSTDGYGWALNGGPCPMSCHAVFAALLGSSRFTCFIHQGPAFDFLEELGCDGSYKSGKVLGRDPGVRYMWLLLAMHVAEDENIMVEVA